MSDKKTDPRLEASLRHMEVAAANFALRTIRMADVRTRYVQQVRDMSQAIRAAVNAGELAPPRGAQIANEMRNQIMEMARGRDFDLGRSLAQRMKARGVTLDGAIAHAMKMLGHDGKPLEALTGSQQRRVLEEVIEAAGRTRPGVTQGIPRLRWLGRGLWFATLAVAGYNIGTSEHKVWQTGRETANIAGGVGGGFLGGATTGALGGAWAGPVGVAAGFVIGGVLGALLSDHAYVEAVGTADPATREFVARFTDFWTGTDEAAIAKALATEHGANLPFVRRVFESLNDSYTTDADDVAVLYVQEVRRQDGLIQQVRADQSLRDALIRILDDGWTDDEELQAIQVLRAT